MADLVNRSGKALSDCGEEYGLIIVDDNSPDGTAEEVRQLQKDHPWLKLPVREKDRDLSTAVLAGWEISLAANFWDAWTATCNIPLSIWRGLLRVSAKRVQA